MGVMLGHKYDAAATAVAGAGDGCCCLLQAVAMLGPGSWFGGGSTIYGSGQLLLALRVVARGAGPACTAADPQLHVTMYICACCEHGLVVCSVANQLHSSLWMWVPACCAAVEPNLQP